MNSLTPRASSADSDGEGRLTPDEVRSVAFPPARFGRRGLDEEHVRAFCSRVEQEIVFLLNERVMLYQHAEQLRQAVVENGVSEPGYSPEAARMQAMRTLANAQKTADRVIAEAQEYCRGLAEGAKQRRDQMLTEARVNASRILEQADNQARSAAAMVAARDSGDSGAGRRSPAEEAAYLRMFSEVYRTHLRAYLEALLQSVEEWGRAENASFGAVAENGPGKKVAVLITPPSPAGRSGAARG